MKNLINLRKRFSLSKKSRTILGSLLLILAVIALVVDVTKMIQYGYFGVSIHLAFSVICCILLLYSKEHSETVILGSALYSLYIIINSFVSVIFNHGYRISLVSLIQILFSAFIIITLYCPINTTIIKAISIAYCAYILVSGIIPVFRFSYTFVEIIQVCVPLASDIIIPLVFACATYEDAEKNAFLQIESPVSLIFTVVLTPIHLILFGVSEALLVGHAYGEEDKFGSYARGLTTTEVATINGMIPLMWLIVAVLFVLLLIHKRTNTLSIASDTNEQTNSTADSTSKVVITGFLPKILVACLIGTIWITIEYGMYK